MFNREFLMFLLICIKHTLKKENNVLTGIYLRCNETQTIGKNMFGINVTIPYKVRTWHMLILIL